MSIVLKKDGNCTAPMEDFEKAQEMVNKGWDVWINKTGKKLVKKSTKSPKKSKKKVEDK